MSKPPKPAIDFQFTRYNNHMKTSVDLIITARWLLPIVPQDTLLEHHAVVIQAGVIVDICTMTTVHEQYQANDIVHLDEHALMPGLINLHTHAAMSLMRG